jgi:hypothetical protein
MAVFYKYCSRANALLTLEKGRLRLSRASDFNDPFDINLHDLYSQDITQVFNDAEALINLLATNPNLFAQVVDIAPEEARLGSNIMRTMPNEHRQELLKALSKLELSPELQALKEEMEPQRAAAISLFRNAGIFCATKNHDNILMWAHYAEQHHGCVLGFEADIQKDSMWALLEPVVYTEIRPSFYGAMNEKILRGEKIALEDITKLTHELIYSKSPHWSYEEELRLYIPDDIPETEAAKYYSFYPSELKAVYIGCRATDETKSAIMKAAISLNPETKFTKQS